MTDIQKALLGNKEAARRLTEQGVLLPCPCCGGEMCVKRTLSIGFFWTCCTDATCGACGPVRNSEYEACLAWNTRAPILSAEELKRLEETTRKRFLLCSSVNTKITKLLELSRRRERRTPDGH